MHTVLNELRPLWRVTLAALIFGAGLPAIFAVGVRFQSLAQVGATGTTDASTPISRRRAAAAVAAVCYAVVLATAIAGVLFVAKAFLASRFGIHLFGQS